MPKSSDFSDVFVSYRRKDVEFVKRLVQALKEAGKNIWIDWEDIPPGSVEFTDDIRRGLEGADAFICVLTPDYLESPYCVDLELSYAVELKKKIIPVVLRKFDDHTIPSGVGHINWIYFTPHAGQSNTFDESLLKVIQALDADLEHVREHKRLLLRALDWDKNERKSSYLLVGEEISSAEQWIGKAVDKDPDPTTLHAQYITASRHQSTKRQRQILTWVTIALVVSLALTVLSGFLWFAAEQARDEAVANAELAATNEAEAVDNWNLAATNEFEAITNANLAATNEAEAIANAELAATSESVAVANAELAATNEAEAVDNWNLAATNEAAAIAAEATAVSRAEEADARLLADQISFIVDRDPVLAYSLSDDLLALENLPLIARENVGVSLYNTGASRVLTGHNGGVMDVAFTPDSQKMVSIACAVNDEGMCIGPEVLAWDVVTGTIVWRGLGHLAEINDVAVSPDGRYVASGSNDNNANLWDAETGQLLRSFYHEDDAYVMSVAFTPDSRFLMTGDDYGAIQLWDVETGEWLNFAEEHYDWVREIDFTSDGQIAVTASDDGTVIVWDMESFAPVLVIPAHEGWVNSVDISPDDTLIVSGGQDNQIALWELSTGDELARIEWHYDWVNGVAFTPDGSQILAASDDSTISTWRVADLLDGILDYPQDSFSGHTSWITALDVSADGALAVTASEDTTLILWDIATTPLLAQLQHATQPINDLAYMPDGETVLVATCTGQAQCEKGQVLAWDWQQGIVTKALTGHTDAITSLAINEDGSKLMTGSMDGSIIIWDYATSAPILERDIHDGWVNAVTFSPDGQTAVSAGDDNMAVIWDVASGAPLNTLRDHVSWVNDVAFTPDGQTIFTVSCGEINEKSATCARGGLYIWDAATGDLIRMLAGHQSDVTSVAVIGDGDYVLTGSDDRTMILWDIVNSEPVRTFFGNADYVDSVAVSGDGQLGISAAGFEINLWELESGERIRSFESYSSWLTAAAFSPDNQTAASVSGDGTLMVWRMTPSAAAMREWAAENRQMRELTCLERELYQTPKRCTGEE